jgi:flagellar biosynthesis/type III secretory pathway M-ring protein FliF/YscJ
VSIGLRQSRFLGLNIGCELLEATVKLIISAAVLCLFARTAVSARQGQEKEKEDKPAQQEQHKKQDGPETHKQRHRNSSSLKSSRENDCINNTKARNNRISNDRTCSAG